MKRLVSLVLVVSAVAVVGSASASSATPSTTTLRGVVVAKDKGHKALVTALASGKVTSIAAPRSFARTPVGARIAVRARISPLGASSIVSLKRTAGRTGVVRGTVVRVTPRSRDRDGRRQRARRSA